MKTGEVITIEAAAGMDTRQHLSLDTLSFDISLKVAAGVLKESYSAMYMNLAMKFFASILKNISKAIEPDSRNPRLIITVPKVGYWYNHIPLDFIEKKLRKS